MWIKKGSGHDPLIIQEWWRGCHCLGLDSCFWNRLSAERLSAEWIQKSTETLCLPIYREMHLSERNFIMQEDNHPKRTDNTIKDVSAEKWKVFVWTTFILLSMRFISWSRDWMEKTPKTNSNWKQLQYKPGKSSQKKNTTHLHTGQSATKGVMLCNKIKVNKIMK